MSQRFENLTEHSMSCSCFRECSDIFFLTILEYKLVYVHSPFLKLAPCTSELSLDLFQWPRYLSKFFQEILFITYTFLLVNIVHIHFSLFSTLSYFPCFNDKSITFVLI